MTTTIEAVKMTRNEVIAKIKAALKRRSGKTWSVTGGRGTAYGWITISVRPSELEGHTIPEARRAELAKLLGLDFCHQQGINVPAGSDYYQEYMDRAEGRAPSVFGKPYWD